MKKLVKNKKLLVFLISFFVYFIGSILIVYSYKLNENFDFLFNSDSARVYWDYATLFENHYRSSVHPLFILFCQPMISILSGLVVNKVLAICIFSSIVGALSNTLIYSFAKLFNKNETTNLLITTIFGISFSNIAFTCNIELYNVAALFLIFLWYIVAKIFKDKLPINNSTLVLLFFLGILSFSITITNFVVFLIVAFILLISKKVKFKQLLILMLSVGISCILLTYVQKIIWHNTVAIGFDTSTSLTTEAKNYSFFDFNTQKIKNVIQGDYYNSIIASSITTYVYGTSLVVGNPTLIDFSIITIFYLIIGFFLIKNFRKNIYLNIGLILTLLFNSVLHLFYDCFGTFLYSEHFLYIFFMLFLINFDTKNKIIKNIINGFLGIFLIITALFNLRAVLNVIRYLTQYIETTFYRLYFNTFELIIFFSLFIIIVLLLLYFIYWQIKKLINKIKNEKKWHTTYFIYVFPIILSIIFLHGLFIILETTPHYKKLAFFEFKQTAAERDYTKHSIKIFKDNYVEEIKAYNNYIDEHYNFIQQYNAETSNEITNGSFYFLGFGERKKLMYSKGNLIDVDTEDIIENFGKITGELIIPNIYTILLKNSNNDFYKIYENENGIFIEKNHTKPTLVSDTDIKINLYDFSKLKYSNILKATYGELLFNIKNSKIYPNILVYKAPFYRDAALAAMVLKNTNNLDLIKKWIVNETEIYDKQNKGLEEPDNLGEMLYMLSLFPNENQKLIAKIEAEAEKLANENKEGYYITGQTDFSNQAGYQNAWYNMALSKLGKTSDFDRAPDSHYNNLTWWSSNGCVKSTGLTANYNFPYITWAQKHCYKDNVNGIMNNALYPVTWEKAASEANYDNMYLISDYYVKNKISPTHTWAAAELMLFILAENNQLEI